MEFLRGWRRWGALGLLEYLCAEVTVFEYELLEALTLLDF